jgi:MtrB/PioB family decaheme-associated outer membrane protein
MKVPEKKCLIAIAALLPLLSVQPAAAQDAGGGQGVAAELDASVGARLTDVSGSTEKFEEYGTVNDGFVLDTARLRLQRPASPNYVELDLRNAAQDDEAYRLAVGRRGRFRLDLQFASIPHRYSGGIFLWGGFGTERLTLPNVVQGQLETFEQTGLERSGPGATSTVSATDPNLDPTGEDAIQRSIVNDLYGSARRVTFQQRRRVTGAGLTYELGDRAQAWVRVANENRRGARDISAGSYERWNVGSGLTHVEDRFVTQGWELAEPLDHRTFTATAGAGLERDHWLADVEYTFTNFSNFDEALLWDNPFRISDAAQTAGGFDRGRFTLGQLVLVPDSVSHDITASGAVDLPLDGRFAASLSYGTIQQNDEFLPYTRNTAILASNVPGTPSAATLARPVTNLDGDVRSFSGTASATVRPVHPVSVGARYHFYRYDGRSDVIFFPGYAAFGESGWRTVKNDRNAPVTNEVFDYTRQEAELSADVHVSRIVSVSAEADWEGWSYDGLRLDGTDEYGVGAGILLRPARAASLRVSYRFADRSIDNYRKGRTAENPEATGLLNYNWSERRRHQADARLQLTPIERVSVGVLARFTDDDHGGETEGGTVVDRFRFGRTDLRTVLGVLDVTFTPGERLGLRGGYSREYRKEGMASAAKDDPPKGEAAFGFGDDYSPVNYWNSDIGETVDSVSAGATFQLVPERLVADASYEFSFSAVDVDTGNPNGVVDTTLRNAIANEWPTIHNRLHEATLDLAYTITPRVRAGARYLFSWYDLDDFAWDIMSPYMAGRSVENSVRFVFADATYGGYRANVGTVYVAGSF